MRYTLIIVILFLFLSLGIDAQELDATVELNTTRIEGTSTSVFDNLKSAITSFLNERRWTNQQYAVHERIKCTFTIIINSYGDDEFKCEAYVQSSRPVYNSSYTTNVFNRKDKDFVFTFHEFDQLEFNDEQIDNSLTALLAFYAYIIIGIDMDTMAPNGGTDILQQAMNLANNAQNLGGKGWKAFDDNSNRFALINDYLDEKLKPMRDLQYKYHRLGMDKMAENPDEARAVIAESLDLLKQVHDAKSMSQWPMIFSEYKRDEIVGIFKGQGSAVNKQPIYEMLIRVNASQSAYWRQIIK